MADAISIAIATVDRTHVIPFKTHADDTTSRLRIEYTMPGIATCSFIIYDLTNSVGFSDNDEMTILDPSTPGQAAFHGYVTGRKLVATANYRIWSGNAVDLNSWLDLKVVGAPDGTHFLQDPPGVFTAYDPNAVTDTSDKATIQSLFATYAPDLPIDTSTYVEEIAPGLPKNWIRWNVVTLRQALDQLAAAINTSIRFWIDADWFFHWTIHPSPTFGYGNAPGPLLRMFPPSPTLTQPPRTLTDGAADGLTSFNYDTLEVEYDDKGWADSIYVAGGTTYTYNKNTHKIAPGGSGWAVGIGPTGRQRILSTPNSATPGVRDAIGGTALFNAQHNVVRGTCRVTTNFGGWFPGQSINLTSAVASLTGTTYPIQRVLTEFISGKGDRILTLEWGDAPRGTIGLREGAKAKQAAAAASQKSVRPGAKLLVTASAYFAGTGGIVRGYAQIVDAAGNAWHFADMKTTWGIVVYDTSGVDVTASTDWALSSAYTFTNAHGMAWVDLTTGPQDNRTYYFLAETEMVDS